MRDLIILLAKKRRISLLYFNCLSFFFLPQEVGGITLTTKVDLFNSVFTLMSLKDLEHFFVIHFIK